MKKVFIATILVLCAAFKSNAQFLGGIFSQGQSKIKIMMEQIAELETSLQELNKGYQTAQQGLNNWQSLKNGTYGLHQNYISSLSNVSPAVKGNDKVQGIINLQQQIIQSFTTAITWQQQQGLLATDEIQYIKAVYNNMLADCNKDLDELNLVVTPGKLQMKDAERIAIIDKLYQDMLTKLQFTGAFTERAYTLANDRHSNKDSNLLLKKLQDIN